MRAIIIAAGEASRWDNYKGLPKHLIEIDGEPLLNRTVRLLKERGIKDIHIVHKGVDERYEVNGATSYIPTLNYGENSDADKFLSSEKLWNKKGTSVILYGDVYFTEYAMNTICEYKGKSWALICRPTPSNFTGTEWGECFAFYLPERSKELFSHTLKHIANLHLKGLIGRCGGWEAYRHMIGLVDGELHQHRYKDHMLIVDDMTDDFDYPQDLDNWLLRRITHAR